MTNLIYTSKKHIFLFFLTILYCTSASSQVVNFTGAVNTNWHNASNWDTGTIPTTSDSVFVDQDVNINSDAEFQYLHLSNGTTTIASGATVEFEINIRIVIGGTLKNEGVLRNTISSFNPAGSSVIYVYGGTLWNLNLIELTKIGHSLIVLEDLVSEAELKNEGTINLNGVDKNSSGNGISAVLESNIRNKAAGVINIDNTLNGISAHDTLFNNGTIVIDSTSSVGIQLLGVLDNYGTITLEEGSGGLNFSINTEGFNQAGGTITIKDAGNSTYGLSIGGNFTNYGIIDIKDISLPAATYSLYISDNSLFTNETNGEITIEDLKSAAAIRSLSSFVNKPGANIDILAYQQLAIYCTVDLNNRGSISIDNPAGFNGGYAITVDGDLLNGPNGNILISDNNSGITVEGNLENEENITLTNLNNPIRLNGGMDNMAGATLSILNFTSTNPTGLHCKSGNYKNFGNIIISDVTDPDGGLLITDDADFVNNGGSITIDDCEKGLYLKLNGSEQGTFTNKNNGILNISDVVTEAIDIEGAGSAITHFDNQATATVNIDGAADGIYSEANFQNTGPLNIENTTTAIKNIGGTFEGDFINSGDLSIQTSTTGISMFNEVGDTEENTFLNNGTITFDDFGTNYIINGNSSKQLNNNGNILGQGYINGSRFLLSSVLTPGNSPGEMVIINEFNTDTNPAYLMEIAGNSGSGVTNGHDRIIINVVNPTLDGLLNVTLLNSFIPSIGDSYELFQCQTSCTENFGTINLPALPADRQWTLNNSGGSITLAVESVLPIELLTFNAVKENGQVLLNWATASEVNSSHFEIERSIDAINWSVIGTQESNHNSSSRKDYFFIDQLENTIANNEIYYRLKSVDYDGRFDFSEIRQVSFEWQSISIQPNPFSHKFSLISPEDGAFEIRLFDELGRLVMSFQESGNIIEIDQLELLPVGFYNLQILSNGSLLKQEKIVKVQE